MERPWIGCSGGETATAAQTSAIAASAITSRVVRRIFKTDRPTKPIPCAASGRDRLYNVAKLGFEWSLFIERRGRRGRPGLAAVSRDGQASQFVTGDSVSSQDLMPHRGPNVGSPADGGAHGPTHGSPSAGAGIVRSVKARSTAPDRGLRPSCADSSAHEPAAERRRCPIIQSKDIKGGGIGR